MTSFMEDKRFDKVIDEIVRDFEANYSSDSWKRLERKLDAEEKDNDQFDKMIAHKLNGYSIPLDNGSFSKFEVKLSQEYKINSDFKWIKNIAATIILMLYVSQLSYIDDNKLVGLENEQLKKIITEKPTFATNRNQIKTFKESITKKSIVSANPNIYGISNFQISDHDAKVAVQNFGLKYIFPPINLNLDYFISNNITKNNNSVGITQDHIIDNSEIFASNFAMDFEVFRLSDQGNENLNLANNTQNNQNIAKQKSSNSNSPNNASEQQTISDESNIFEYKVDNIISIPKKSVEISAFAAPTYCMISTPNDVDMGVPGYSNQTYGYETGINFGFKKSVHEFGSGLILNTLKYSPKKIVVSENGKLFWLDEISYKIIGIPLFYKYNYFKSKKTNLYVTSTIQPDLMVYSDYKFIQNDNISGNLVKLAEELIETNDFKNTLYAAKQYKSGTFEGGKSNENFSIAMSIGLGLQTEIQNTYSFFIEPVFNYTILKNDFGPNHDKLSFLSLKLGINKTIDL